MYSNCRKQQCSCFVNREMNFQIIFENNLCTRVVYIQKHIKLTIKFDACFNIVSESRKKIGDFLYIVQMFPPNYMSITSLQKFSKLKTLGKFQAGYCFSLLLCCFLAPAYFQVSFHFAPKTLQSVSYGTIGKMLIKIRNPNAHLGTTL